MRLSCARNTVCKNRNIESLKERLEMRSNWHSLAEIPCRGQSMPTFIRKKRVLCRLLRIHSIKLKAKHLRKVPWVRDPNNIHWLSLLAGLSPHNCVSLQLLSQRRADASYDADRHCSVLWVWTEEIIIIRITQFQSLPVLYLPDLEDLSEWASFQWALAQLLFQTQVEVGELARKAG